MSKATGDRKPSSESADADGQPPASAYQKAVRPTVDPAKDRIVTAVEEILHQSRKRGKVFRRSENITIGGKHIVGSCGGRLKQTYSNAGLRCGARCRRLSHLARLLAGVGLDLRTIQRHRPQLQNAHLARQQQNLDEQRLDLLQKALRTIAFSAASVLITSLIIIGTFKTGIVAALTATTTDATSTISDTTARKRTASLATPISIPT